MKGTTVPDNKGHVQRDKGTGQPAPFRGLSPVLSPESEEQRALVHVQRLPGERDDLPVGRHPDFAPVAMADVRHGRRPSREHVKAAREALSAMLKGAW